MPVLLGVEVGGGWGGSAEGWVESGVFVNYIFWADAANVRDSELLNVV